MKRCTICELPTLPFSHICADCALVLLGTSAPSSLSALSPAGMAALGTALEGLPRDGANPVPLCERIAQVLDVVVPLIRRQDLPDTDRRILFALCNTDGRVLRFAELINNMDREARIRKIFTALGFDPIDPEVVALRFVCCDYDTFLVLLYDLIQRKGAKGEDTVL